LQGSQYGIVVDTELDCDKLNEYISKEIADTFGLKSEIRFEREDMLDAYFYKMKNYVVRQNKRGKLITVKHGCALKASRHASIYDKVMDSVIQKTLDREVADQLMEAERMKNLDRYTLRDFACRMTFSKDMEAYGDARLSPQRFLGIQVESRLKVKVDAGLQVEYYVTKEPPKCEPLLKEIERKKKTKPPYYTISVYVKDKDQLDHEYYRNQLDRVFKIFDWDIDPQLSLDLE
jgi:hypothetical protein